MATLATLCYIERDGKYLMLHRIKKQSDMHKGLWVGLGGKLEPGESPEECVVREVFEESGLTIHDPRLRGILTFPADAGNADWYVFLFSATQFEGEIRECDEGELHWIDKDEVPALPMHEGDRLFLRKLNECKGLFTAKYRYECDVLKDCSFCLYE